MSSKVIDDKEIKKTKNIQHKKAYKLTAISTLILICVYLILKHFLNIDVVIVLRDLFMLEYLPKLESDMGVIVLFIFGLLTSFHCIGMCGGIAISQTVGKPWVEDGKQKKLLVIPSILYNLGRVISYTIVGGIVGGVGQLFSFGGVLKGIVPIIGGIFMVIMGINLLGVLPFLRRVNLRMPLFFARKVQKGKKYGPLYVGLLSGLMPCGPLQMVQLYALGTRNIWLGAISMLIFSIGTVPTLFVFGAINILINKKFSNFILKVSAALIVVLGVVMLGRGLALSGISISLPHVMNSSSESSTAIVQGDIQTVTTHIDYGSYPVIMIQKGIKVRWNLKADEDKLNDCNNAIVIPKLNIDRKLEAGDNIIEFFPHETGDILYTCWMGMIKSRIIIVDKIDENVVHN
ncbi:MAG TPA: sulfite exporter TauE/SafE family protein [Pseudobacteroides sp.]|uniref:sulfite exporter TauE/SafE family protein n=1 Tax=Pseudobacteroides sp. TaxID=1968840 RepID=UPI002F94AB14